MKLDFHKKYTNIYFIGIGGISMSGLAEILNHRGITVAGSDLKPSETTKHLESIGILVHYGHDAKNITSDIQLVVFTAAVKEDNAEIIAAKEQGIPIIERSQLLGALMDSYAKSIAISGTHGKTSTTSMISEILLAADTDPTISIGGILPSIGGNTKIGSSPFFLAEACEYHNSFLQFHPYIGVILNVEAEHLDFFKDLKDVQASFKAFAQNVPEEGYVIIQHDTSGKAYIIENLSSHVISYGFSTDADWYPQNISYDSKGHSSFDVFYQNTLMGKIFLQVPGEHNILNALAACSATSALGLSMDTIILGLNRYTGVNRRFQNKGSFQGAQIIDDYAHHPSEVKATLSAAKNVEHRRLWCIFQPHTYTRLKNFLNDFANAFEDADEIIVTDIYAAREKDTGIIHANDLVSALKDKGKNAQYAASFDDVMKIIKSTVHSGDLLITMGAGDIYLVGEALIQEDLSTVSTEL